MSVPLGAPQVQTRGAPCGPGVAFAALRSSLRPGLCFGCLSTTIIPGTVRDSFLFSVCWLSYLYNSGTMVPRRYPAFTSTWWQLEPAPTPLQPPQPQDAPPANPHPGPTDPLLGQQAMCSTAAPGQCPQDPPPAGHGRTPVT
ncbi:hypothetical protein mRhiFer1_008324 [Rhinolophus ferrumequinum]|uniref:Uncharacterized protein n=1 Tax=Rhinolophus ferrumequinum TaxID=59479 RepID=A0A7J7VRE0_RHIFE|nr:hypothetical protein mRhiFer1_008324 [Rhinolophus ferrumequinum]